MASKYLNLSTDDTLGGNTPSDYLAVSQKAIKTYVDNNSGGGGSVDIDGVTITENTSNEIQTVGVIDSRSGNAIKTWTGNKAQYEAIVTKDANTVYNVDDGIVDIGDLVDGQWVESNYTVFANTYVSTTDNTYSLSSYLPNDGYNYEILFDAYAIAPTGTYFMYKISSSLTNAIPFFANNNNTSGEMTLSGNALIPVGTNRNITILGGQWYSTNVKIELYARAYRRVGTNV